MASGDTKTEAMLNALGNGGSADEFRGCCNTKTQQYILDAIDRVQNVEDEVEELKNNPDVVDIVDTYADLQAYDTQHLSDNDIIRVLADETHSGNSTYYKFNKQAGTWTFIGEIAGGGGGAEFIELTTADYNWNSLSGETGTPNCVALWLLPSGIYKGPASTSIEVRATRSQGYSMGSGFSSYAIVKECENTNTNRAIVTYVDGSNGNVVEYYSIGEDGTGYSTKNFPNVVQTTGTSTTSVMSQNAVTSMVFADPANATRISIGNSNAGTNAISLGQYAYGAGTDSIAIGAQANTYNGSDAVAVGQAARARSNGTVAIGYNANQGGSGANGSVSIGAFSSATSVGEMNIGSTDTSYGYNSTNYRLLSGVHDAVGNHDAVTLGQLNTRLGSLTITTISQTDYNNLQTKDPNTLYLITGA